VTWTKFWRIFWKFWRIFAFGEIIAITIRGSRGPRGSSRRISVNQKISHAHSCGKEMKDINFFGFLAKRICDGFGVPHHQQLGPKIECHHTQKKIVIIQKIKLNILLNNLILPVRTMVLFQ
jgi:hypothetical protein